jgi:hypothetical protein
MHNAPQASKSKAQRLSLKQEQSLEEYSASRFSLSIGSVLISPSPDNDTNRNGHHRTASANRMPTLPGSMQVKLKIGPLDPDRCLSL